ncbi:unnamed protein product [Allacma fusca]|uniref:Amidase domain-containing protein n=1 Tax=Allacma fusca TaxID=39272 RepID=A0A8J2KAG7_9HEXA|nr:unnamed protein product [Allacma fusca]
MAELKFALKQISLALVVFICINSLYPVKCGLFRGCNSEACLKLEINRGRKQQERDEVLNDLRFKFMRSDVLQAVGDLPFHQLIHQLQTRNLSAVQVLSAFIGRAVNATDEFNCVTEFVPNAMKWARLSPAGSSSGSGCIVASKAAHFATGTDSMGSGRLPAHFNGIASIMPTSRRLSTEGITLAIPKLIGMNAVPAIFADKPSTLATVFRALTDNNIQNLYDPTTVPMSWKAQVFENKRPLRFGYLTSIPFFPTMGDTPLVIEETKIRLEALGHTVVPFELPDGYRFMKLMIDLIFADGGHYLASQIKDDKIATAFKSMYFGIQFPSWQKQLAGTFPMSDRLQIILQAGVDTEKSIGLQEAVEATKELAKEILKQMQEYKLDLLLTPVFPVPALRLDDPSNLFLAVCYVVIWNLVDFPAGVIPMGTESGQYTNFVDTKGDVFLNLAKTNLKHAKGMPIGVQIVGKPFQEELILRTLYELESLVFVSSGLLDSCLLSETCRQFEVSRTLKQHERTKILTELRLRFLRSDINHTIGDLPFHELVHQLQTRNLSAVEALSVFIGRAVKATDEFNCVSEFVPDAMKWAMELDNALGSGRLPAHFNGIASIVPTSRRLSIDGVARAIPKLIGINPVPAIFSDKASTLATIFKALTENDIQNRYDPTTVPVSWRANLFESNRSLRFGYLTSIPFFPTMGDTPLVVEATKQKLEALGHTVVPFELPDGYRFMKLMIDLIFADGGNYLASQIQDDQIATAIKTLYYGLKFPNWQKKLVGAIPISDRLQIILRSGVDTEKSSGLQEAVDATRQLSKEILDQMHHQNLDLLLTPVFPVPALRLDDPPYLFLGVCYVALWNLVDFPAGVIPMGTESGRNINISDTSGDIFLNLAKTNLQEAIGMPIGVQLVGKPFQEELILNVLNELEGNEFSKTTLTTTKTENPK